MQSGDDMNKLVPALMMAFLVTGCAVHPQPRIAPPPPPPQPVVEKPTLSAFDARVGQCRDELDALQSYNVTVYQQYRQRFDRINGQLSKYMEIRGKIGSDIDDIALPKYQFNLRNLCFDIRSELTRQIVKEA